MVLAIAVVMVVLGYLVWPSNDFDQPNANISINQEANLNTSQLETTSQGTIIPPDKMDCQDELDTECWKIYRNDEYIFFEFKYPTTWKLLKPHKFDDSFAIFEENGSDVNIQVGPTFPDLNSLSVEEKSKKIIEDHSDRDIKRLLLDNRESFYFLGYGKSSHYIPGLLLALNSYVFHIDMEFIPEGREKYYEDTLKAFIQTIKINQNQ